jgi:hypothetical protein
MIVLSFPRERNMKHTQHDEHLRCGTRHGTCHSWPQHMAHGTAHVTARHASDGVSRGFCGGCVPVRLPRRLWPGLDPALVHAAPCRAVPARRSARGCSPRCAIPSLRAARCAFERVRRMPHDVWSAAAALSWSRASGSLSTTTSRTRSAPSPTRCSRRRSSCRTTRQERSPVCVRRLRARACACRSVRVHVRGSFLCVSAFIRVHVGAAL